MHLYLLHAYDSAFFKIMVLKSAAVMGCPENCSCLWCSCCAQWDEQRKVLNYTFQESKI